MSRKAESSHVAMKLAEKIETTHLHVFQDPDGPWVIQQFFSDGSSVMMHAQQYYAIAVSAARHPEKVLSAYS